LVKRARGARGCPQARHAAEGYFGQISKGLILEACAKASASANAPRSSSPGKVGSLPFFADGCGWLRLERPEPASRAKRKPRGTSKAGAGALSLDYVLQGFLRDPDGILFGHLDDASPPIVMCRPEKAWTAPIRGGDLTRAFTVLAVSIYYVRYRYRSLLAGRTACQAHPSTFIAHPAFQIFVMCRILSPLKSMT
jgi:hypothetical protein